MTEKEFIQELNRRKEIYIEKSKLFNSKKTLLFVKEEEKEEMLNFSTKNQIDFDEIVEINKNEKILQILEKHKNNINYFFSNGVMSDSLHTKIMNTNIDKNNIYIGPTKNSYVDLYEKRDKIYSNANKICKVLSFLEDTKSKEVYWNILVRLCLPYQYHYYYESEDFIQYFPKDFKFNNEEIYLDAGVYDGKNIYQFIEKVENSYKYIYGVEADPNNYKKSRDNLKLIERLELLQKALYIENEEISFLSTDSSSKKGNAHVQPFGDISVYGLKGDSLKERPTFIKMDIEGSEKDALEGLRDTIKDKGPKLAICIYHFQEDFWEVPLKIKELNPNYNLMIRNHEKMFCLIESVCYAYIK